MRIKEKILFTIDGLEKYGPVNIVILGDSISHGEINSYYDYENVYCNLLKQKLHKFRDYMPINMINAAVSGSTAKEALKRMERDVLSHRPDLVIVCLGLNDVNGTLDGYLDLLRQIFDKCLKVNCDVIFMTPNMLNTYVADDTPEQHSEYALETARMKSGGRMDEFVFFGHRVGRQYGCCCL